MSLGDPHYIFGRLSGHLKVFFHPLLFNLPGQSQFYNTALRCPTHALKQAQDRVTSGVLRFITDIPIFALLLPLFVFFSSNLSAFTEDTRERDSRPKLKIDNLSFRKIDLPKVEKIGEIRAIVEDTVGFIWVAGSGGVGRFDGNELILYNSAASPTGGRLPLDTKSMLLDTKGRLWLATFSGLIKYDELTADFVQVELGSDRKKQFRLYAVTESRQGGLWLGFDVDGFAYYEPESGHLDIYADPLRVGEISYSPLTNGDFSDGFSNWISFAINEGAASFTVDNGQAHIDVKDPGDKIWSIQMQQTALLPIGETYSLNFEAKTDHAPRRFTVIIESNGVPWTKSAMQEFTITEANVLQPFALEWVHALRRPEVKIGFHFGAQGNADVWLDNVNLAHQKNAVLADSADGQTEDAQSSSIGDSLAESKENLNATVKTLLESTDGILWIGGMDSLTWFDTERKTFVNLDPGYSLTDNRVTTIYQTRQNQIWVGTESGINRYVPEEKKFIRYFRSDSDLKNAKGLLANNIGDLAEDAFGRIFVLAGGGLHLYSSETDRFIRHTMPSMRNMFESPVRALSMQFSHRGDLWMGHFPFGLSVSNRYSGAFRVFRHFPENSKTLSHSSVNSLEVDSDGKLWVGTEYGLNLLNLNTQSATRYLHDPMNPETLSSNIILSLLAHSSGRLFIGTWDTGVNMLDPNSGIFHRYPLSHTWSLAERDGNSLWVGTSTGLTLLNIPDLSFTLLDPLGTNSDGLDLDLVWAISPTLNNDVWISSVRKNLLVDAKTLRKKNIANGHSELAKLESKGGRVIYSAKSGDVWIGGNGLQQIDQHHSKVTHYGEKEGFTDGVTTSIVEDKNNNLWLATDSGLARLDVATKEFTFFNKSHGLPTDTFNRNAAANLPDGQLAIGSPDGLIIFDPDDIFEDSAVAPIVFKSLKVANQQVVAGAPNSPLELSIQKAKEIKLNYSQNMFTVEYSSLEYQLSEKVEFAYRLLGFADEWNEVGGQRMATYTNLNPGNYLFEVKSRDGRGEWGDPKGIAIHIYPPLWRTWWAYLLYVAATLCLIFLIGYVIFSKQEAERAKELNRKLKDVDKLKDQILANTSHELRTPLHGIIGLTDLILMDEETVMSPKGHELLTLIKSSGHRLSELINDILDFSRLRGHAIELDIQGVKLHDVVSQIILLSNPLISEKPVKIVNHVSNDLPMLAADKNRLLQILHNLVGNAVKFTHEGSITISAEATEAQATVCVSDTGIGIPEGKTESIFLAFEQADGTIERKYGGTGLGLSISRKLVELHGGNISITSQEGVGTTVIFSLPIFGGVSLNENPPLSVAESIDEPSELYSESEMSEAQSRLGDGILTAGADPKFAAVDTCPRLIPQGANEEFPAGKILVVDDELVNRRVLAEYLTDCGFSVTQSFGGREALELIADNSTEAQEFPIYDLVLLDVMMPEVSGHEVCQTIRRSWGKQDFPVIFLTAQTDSSSVERCYQVGGNDYLAKPFSKAELLARINVHLSLVYSHRNLERIVKARTSMLEETVDRLAESRQELFNLETAVGREKDR